jgi:ribosomal subunit interface protein
LTARAATPFTPTIVLLWQTAAQHASARALLKAAGIMKMHLSLHQLKLTESIHHFVVEKIAALREIAADVQSADIVLARHSDVEVSRRFSVSVRLAVPGDDVHACDTSADLYAAVDGVQNKLARLLRKRKTRRTDTQRQKHQRSLERHRSFGTPLPHEQQPVNLLPAVGNSRASRTNGDQRRRGFFL